MVLTEGAGESLLPWTKLSPAREFDTLKPKSRYPNVDTKRSEKVSMREPFPTLHVQIVHLMIVFSPCLLRIRNIRNILCEILNSSLPDGMHYIFKLLFTFDLS